MMKQIKENIKLFFKKNKGELGCGGELRQITFIDEKYVCIESKYSMDANTMSSLQNITNGKLVYRSSEGKVLIYKIGVIDDE